MKAAGRGTDVMNQSFYSICSSSEKKQITEDFKLANILELSPQEQQILLEIKERMGEEARLLALDIEDLQAVMMGNPVPERPPTAKELKDFQVKLEVKMKLLIDRTPSCTQTMS